MTLRRPRTGSPGRILLRKGSDPCLYPPASPHACASRNATPPPVASSHAQPLRRSQRTARRHRRLPRPGAVRDSAARLACSRRCGRNSAWPGTAPSCARARPARCACSVMRRCSCPTISARSMTPTSSSSPAGASPANVRHRRCSMHSSVRMPVAHRITSICSGAFVLAGRAARWPPSHHALAPHRSTRTRLPAHRCARGCAVRGYR